VGDREPGELREPAGRGLVARGGGFLAGGCGFGWVGRDGIEPSAGPKAAPDAMAGGRPPVAPLLEQFPVYRTRLVPVKALLERVIQVVQAEMSRTSRVGPVQKRTMIPMVGHATVLVASCTNYRQGEGQSVKKA